MSYDGNTIIQGGTLSIESGIDAAGTKLIDVQSGLARLQTTNVNRTDLNITTGESATFEVASGRMPSEQFPAAEPRRSIAARSLTAASIQQDTLAIGGHVAAVPEPAALTLLLSGVSGFTTNVWRRRRHVFLCFRRAAEIRRRMSGSTSTVAAARHATRAVFRQNASVRVVAHGPRQRVRKRILEELGNFSGANSRICTFPIFGRPSTSWLNLGINPAASRLMRTTFSCSWLGIWTLLRAKGLCISSRANLAESVARFQEKSRVLRRQISQHTGG